MLSPAPQSSLTICVVADDDGTDAGLVNECDEENNQCCTEVPAFCCVNDLAARAKSGKVQLTWADTGADHYNVYRGTTSGGPYMFIATTDSRYSTYLDLDVVNETTYYYVMREAAIGGEELCQSNEATATPIGIPSGASLRDLLSIFCLFDHLLDEAAMRRKKNSV